MTSVGIRELKNRLSEFMHRVDAGERMVVTDRGRPVAVILPTGAGPDDRRIEEMLREGLARWKGGKPRGAARPPRMKGPSVSEAVVEDRR